MDSARRLVLACLGLNIKYCTSPGLNSTRWLGLFSNKTFRKRLKLTFPHRDFIICIVSLAIFHPHFVIHIFPSASVFPSAFLHPHFAIRNFPSAFYHPHFSIRHPPPSGPHFTETPRDVTLPHRKPINGLVLSTFCLLTNQRKVQILD